METVSQFQKYYQTLFDNSIGDGNNDQYIHHEGIELPLVDLCHLSSGDLSKHEACKRDIRKAASEWGTFQVKNHGISRDIMKRMQSQQVKLFRQPFEKKSNDEFAKLWKKYYKWGTPSATSLGKFSWSEAWHIPVGDVIILKEVNTIISTTIAQYAKEISELGQEIAGMLAMAIKCRSTFFEETFPILSSYIRLNRYPTCPITSNVFVLVPHNDSDFLTVLQCQDRVGGLQIVKDRKWLSIKPNSESLIIIIGDLFHALSNGTYKSIEHRVVLPLRVNGYERRNNRLPLRLLRKQAFQSWSMSSYLYRFLLILISFSMMPVVVLGQRDATSNPEPSLDESLDVLYVFLGLAAAIFGSVGIYFLWKKYSQRLKLVSSDVFDTYPIHVFVGSSQVIECFICTEAYVLGDIICTIPCGHAFHDHHIREWLTKRAPTCPTCHVSQT